MFGQFRNPRGGYSLLAAGVACLALAGWAAAMGGPALALPLAGGLGLAGIVLLGLGWRRQRESRYDLGRLWEEPRPDPEEPLYDTVPRDESAPYCGWCDEAYPPGTHRCTRCGRELG